MKLSQLIEQTLCEIASGIDAAKEKTRELDLMVIAPNRIDDQLVAEMTYVEFDISVIVEESDAQTSSKERGLGGELRVLSVGINGKTRHDRGDSQSSSSKASHRIMFKVPVSLSSRYLERRGRP